MRNIALFLKRNAVYLIVAFCVLAVGLTVLLIAVSGNKSTPVSNDNKIVITDDDNNNVNPVINPGDEITDPVIETPEPITNNDPVSTTIIFEMPVASFSRVEDYSEKPVFNSTLNRFSAHKAMDFFAEEGTNVLAVYDGVVESVTNDLLKGYTVVIDHGNGLKTLYNSLQDGDAVVKGQTVKKGDIIGEVSSTNRQEYKEGSHLHFEVTENGNTIDPAVYLLIEDK